MKLTNKVIKEAKQVVRLSSLKNMAYVLASKVISVNGFYTCKIDGVKTLVLSDSDFGELI